MSSRVSFADLLKAGAEKDKQRLNLKLAPPTPPVLKAAAPEKDFTRVANSIVREAVPDGLFIGKSKQIYDYLYSITRGAVQPVRSVRVTKTNLMRNADIGSERTLRKNLAHLNSLGLIKITELTGQHQGNEYETFLPEEILSDPLQSLQSHQSHQSLQKVEGVLPPLSAVTAVGKTTENKATYSDPKTFFKDFKEDDDEPAAQNAARNATADEVRGVVEKVLGEISKKMTGKDLKADDEKLKELAELLAMEFEIAAARTDSISNVPAFLTEHLRRRLLRKHDHRTPDRTAGAKGVGKSLHAGKADDSIQTDSETYQAEPLTEQGKMTVLKTMREYLTQGQREFVMSLQDSYTAEDWQWLSRNLSDKMAEK